ncbi:MAG TPA: bifunctional UDP-N-acetylglucosamine diphosphorylase/glucosamine-1-phosphate N-acetyltransferase GlmU [Thermodesulfovibrionales bacterium]|nr:bifunctional UDP-N-acetylglucosamine diphosphorylase/glucosamine-1-phosphate N-acetyltransferase GlmU [Thermodesulfovibrionales bacterium]
MKLACVILAAGLGKRMKSSLPKVLHTLCGRPMLRHVLDNAGRLRPEKRIVVVGKYHEEISRSASGPAISFVVQEKPKGTGDALMKAGEALGRFRGTVLVLNGDTPLIAPETLRRFLSLFSKNGDALSVLSFTTRHPEGYGRIVRDDSGKPRRIIEEKAATAEQKMIMEVNGGIYAVDSKIMPLLARIRRNPASGEYYLTDLFEIAMREKLRAGVYCICGEDEMMGVNTRHELLRAERIMQTRIVNGLIRKGVTFIDPSSAHIGADVSIGADAVIYPNVCLEGATRIGRQCTVYPNVRIVGSTIGDGATIKDCSVIEHSAVKRNAQIGPFAHLRPGTIVGARAKIGNFVEVKKSVIGEGTKASHLSYLGDAVVGRNVNIGAGTITCNYDGAQKHRTEIDDGVFIGSDTQLVAPVKIGKGAYIGAGSTVTKDVPPMSLAVSRTPQKNILKWAQRKQHNENRRHSKKTFRRRPRTGD